MECSWMFSIAAFGPRDPVSIPGWFAVSNSNKNWVNNTWIIQAYDRATTIVMWLRVGVINSHLSCSIDG